MEISLSDTDMERFLPQANLLTYTELADAFAAGHTIYDLLGPGKCLVLLYLSKRNHGHWTCVFERSNGDMECFDSFGYLPDDQLNFVPRNFVRASKQNHTYLLRLLAKTGKPIHYNKDPLQIMSPTVNTCGRHVICRIAFRNLHIDDYVRMMRSAPMSPDEIVTLATLKF